MKAGFVFLLFASVLTATTISQVQSIKHVYRPGEQLLLTVLANETVALTNSLGQQVNMTLLKQGGTLLASYSFRPEDPPGVWTLTVSGSSETIYLIKPIDFLLVILMAALLNIILAVGRKRLIDLKRFRRISQELAVFNREMIRALRANDSDKLAKLKKKEKYMNELKGQVAKDQMKLLIFSLAVGYLLYFILIRLEGNASLVVAYMPLSIPLLFFTLGPAITMLQFYIIASTVLASLVTKALGAGLA